MPTRQTTTRSRRQDSGRNTSKRPARPAASQRQDVQVDEQEVEELLLQALETERGGIQVYETAIACAQNDELREEWEKYLEETRNHERILTELLGKWGLDAEKETPGREVVRTLGESLVQAMHLGQRSGKPEAAQLVAAECVVLAETKDHLNWQLLEEIAEATGDEDLVEAVEEVEDQEDEHLYHTMGWVRELWLDSLGVGGQLPPPEETQDVKSMAEAARAKKSRTGPSGKSRSGGGSRGRKPGR